MSASTYKLPVKKCDKTTEDLYNWKVCCITDFTYRTRNVRHMEPSSSQTTVEPLGCSELKVKRGLRTPDGLKSLPAGHLFRCRVEGQTAE